MVRLERLRGDPDPIAVWQYAERYLGGGTRDYSRFGADQEIPAACHPQRGPPSFPVPTFRVPAPRRGGWLDSPALTSELPSWYRDGGTVLLPVHPRTLAHPGVAGDLAGLPSGPVLRVVPTANGRTVFVQRLGGAPVPPHFLKLHYPARLSRFTRRLRRPIIALQLWVAGELAALDAPVLPEVGGGVVGADPVQGWGFLLREPAVAGSDAGRWRYTLPLFALYGRDLHAPGDPTLLEQLVTDAGADPAQWVAQRLVIPMVSLFARVLLATGCAIELHGQNTLLQLSADLRETRIAYRDCAVYVDPALRAVRGLTRPLPPRNVISHDVDKPRAQVLSLVYDSFLGHHTLAYVARVLADRFGVPPAVPQAAAAAALAGGGAADLLPPTVYYYDDRLHPDGGWHLVDTGRRPTWR